MIDRSRRKIDRLRGMNAELRKKCEHAEYFEEDNRAADVQTENEELALENEALRKQIEDMEQKIEQVKREKGVILKELEECEPRTPRSKVGVKIVFPDVPPRTSLQPNSACARRSRGGTC